MVYRDMMCAAMKYIHKIEFIGEFNPNKSSGGCRHDKSADFSGRRSVVAFVECT